MGNRLSEPTQAGLITYTHDAANRLSSLRLGNTVYTYTYGYNGVSDRMRQVTNGVTIIYLCSHNDTGSEITP